MRNFYVVNPTYLGTMYGGANGTITPALYVFGSWIDVPGIKVYGFRPEISNPPWFADPSGQAAQKNDPSAIQQAVNTLTLRLASFYEPTPVTANGYVVTNLRPDVLRG